MFMLIIFAILSGIMTVLSPCILPILPLLLAAGINGGQKKPIGIIIGLVFSFSFFTLFFSQIAQATGISPNTFRYGAIIMIIFSGLTMIFPTLTKYTMRLTSLLTNFGTSLETQATKTPSGLISGFITGIALGLLWSPCAGPILAAITSLAATQTITWKAMILTLSYSLGASIPMFFIMYGGNKIIQATQSLTHYAEIIRKLFGILMIAGALVIAFHVDTILQIFTLKYFPSIIIDNNATIKKELDMMRSQQNGQPLLNTKALELVDITQWFNSKPLSLNELRGNVILLDFWTYSCINCIRTLPHLNKLYETYKNNNFIIIGVHTPEFTFEKMTTNVQSAIKRFNIQYPVALDSNYSTWNAYGNQYWPTQYLIDKQGTIVNIHVGEGGYTETENMIRTLLGLATITETCQPQTINALVTPEIYLGYQRATHYHPEIMPKKDITSRYNYTMPLADDKVGLTGPWLVASEYIRSESNASTITVNFFAQHVCIVMESSKNQTIHMFLDGKKITKTIKVHEPRMYNVYTCKDKCERHTLTLKCPKGVTLYTFTFG